MIDALITRPLFIIVVHDFDELELEGKGEEKGSATRTRRDSREENGRRVQFAVLGIVIRAVTGHGIVIRTTNDSPSNWSDGRNDQR